MKSLIDNPTLADQPVSAYMTAPPHTVRSDQSLFDALVISHAEKVRHLPVVDDDDKLAGIVTHTDLAHAHFHVIELQRTLIDRAIRDRTEELEVANRELESLSMEDALLGIGNRRAMEVDMEHTHSLSTRHQRSYVVALLDVDHFKTYNDHYGHAAGDEALKQVAGLVRDSLRNTERVYRYGGEEFVMILPDTTAQGALAGAEKMLHAVAKLDIEHRYSDAAAHITLSIGVASASPNENTLAETLIEAADQMLYRAKDRGRNCIEVALHAEPLRSVYP